MNYSKEFRLAFISSPHTQRVQQVQHILFLSNRRILVGNQYENPYKVSLGQIGSMLNRGVVVFVTDKSLWTPRAG